MNESCISCGDDVDHDGFAEPTRLRLGGNLCLPCWSRRAEAGTVGFRTRESRDRAMKLQDAAIFAGERERIASTGRFFP